MAFLVLTSVFSTNLKASGLSYTSVGNERISEGVHLSRYFLDIGGQSVAARKLTVDLENPFVEIQAMHPEEGFNNKQTVRNMAAREGAVAAVNADFFHLTRPAAPFGLHVENQQILSSPFDNDSWKGFGVDVSGAAHIMNWRFRGEVICGEDYRYPLYGYNQTYQTSNEILVYDRTWGSEVASDFFDDPVLKVTVRDGRVVRLERNTAAAVIPEDGFVVVAEGSGANFLMRYARIGEPLEFRLGVEPNMDLDTAVGGQLLLVDGGVPVDPGRLSPPGSTRAARTAVGINPDGTEVYFVVIEGSAAVQGLTMEELSIFMSDIGAYRALNLDGGGSCTMVARPLGEFAPVLMNQPRWGTERAVPNAIGIFNRAPQTDPSVLFLRGPESVFAGSEASYEVSGHDRHYHPLKIEKQRVKWEVSDSSRAQVTDGRLEAIDSGEVTLRVLYGGASEEKDIRVLGSEDVASFAVLPEEINLLPGQSQPLRVKIRTLSDQLFEAGARTVQWHTDLGRVKDNVYRAADEEGAGTLTAVIGEHRVEVPIRIGGTRESFFTFREWQTVSFRSHPAGLPGSFEIVTDTDYVYHGERSGRLRYDFSQDIDEPMIAYGQLGSGQISMGSGNLGISAYVYGDASEYWLRAEILDADGTRRYVDLADSIDWEGWRRVQGEIDPQWPQPLTMSSVYLVHQPRHREAGSPRTGEIFIDNIEVVREYTEEDSEEAAPVEIKMKVGSQQYTVSGRQETMDAAPFIENGRTFVPVRVLGEAFGAQVSWSADPETGLTDEVRLQTDRRLIVMNIGEPEMVIGDVASDETETVLVDEVPRIIGGRTYLPLRAIGEDAFGAEVGYSTDPETGLVDYVWLSE